jgi:hypothetical protein
MIHPMTLKGRLTLQLPHIEGGFQLYSPNDGSSHNSLLTAEDIGEKTRDESSKPRTTSHGGGYTSLDGCFWAITVTWALIEIAFVGIRADAGSILANELQVRNVQTSLT